MKYIIDGHNLIPKIPGLSLSDPDDEEKLISILSRWASQKRHQLTVFFDKAPQGYAGTRKVKGVTAVFVQAGSTADAAIIETLRRAKAEARNMAVVSSDRMVQAAVRSVHAQSIRSESFAQSLLKSPALTEGGDEGIQLTSDEIAQWEAIFTADSDEIQ